MTEHKSNNSILDFSSNMEEVLKHLGSGFGECKKIDFNDLPKYSPWPRRLLGIEKFRQRVKSKDEILREYENEKWRPLLQTFKSRNWKLFSEFRNYVDGDKTMTPYYWMGDIFHIKEKSGSNLQANLIYEVLSLFLPVRTVVELGCGFGAMLLDIAGRNKFKGIDFIGGDLSSSGVELVTLMAEQFNLPITAHQFDFNNFNANAIPDNSVIYTSFSLACVPCIERTIIEGLISAHPKAVIHLEPVYPESLNPDMFQLMMRRYIEINGYGCNLASLLRSMEKDGLVDILVLTEPILGGNPFIPLSVIVWRPASRGSENLK